MKLNELSLLKTNENNKYYLTVKEKNYAITYYISLRKKRGNIAA